MLRRGLDLVLRNEPKIDIYARVSSGIFYIFCLLVFLLMSQKAVLETYSWLLRHRSWKAHGTIKVIKDWGWVVCKQNKYPTSWTIYCSSPPSLLLREPIIDKHCINSFKIHKVVQFTSMNRYWSICTNFQTRKKFFSYFVQLYIQRNSNALYT